MVKNQAIRGATGALALVCLLLPGGSVFAGDGDYDFDFDVDADDFAYWGSCMTVPDSGDVDPFSPCAAFDFDNDNDVDNYDFGAFQAAFQKPVPPCKPIDKNDPSKKAYAGATLVGHDILGADAMIDTRTIVLCGEPNSTKRASSWAWAGVEHRYPIFPSEPLEYGIDKWFQVGCVRQRIEGGTQIWWVRYTEVKFGPLDPWIKLYSNLPSGSHTYKCWKTRLGDGSVYFEFDGTADETFMLAGWYSVAGHFSYGYKAEIANKDDRMVGTSADPCHFKFCKYKWKIDAQHIDGWRDANIIDAPLLNGNLHTDDAQQWEVDWDAPNHIHVWDVVVP